jgi:transcriptional regulator with PAS, ATPase and Fis domain
MNILISWIGDTDFRTLLNDKDKQVVDLLKGELRKAEFAPKDGGPVKTMLKSKKFDKIYLLSNRSKELTSAYIDTLDSKLNVEFILKAFENPSDYKEVYTATSDALEFVFKNTDKHSHELSILLSPGTPAMAAIWVLLGKTNFPAKFWQTWNGNATETEIPFDITLDVVSEVINRADGVFKHLLESAPADIAGFEAITGDSKAIRLAVGRARKVAIRDVSVLLFGESGTGKELFANAMHKASLRKDKPFVAINCAAIPKELLESELFGHVKGAFTGARDDKDGAFKRADGGVLFLDEVGECDLQMQAKLLRVLQPPIGASSSIREFLPVGAEKVETSNVRVVAATNRNLAEMIKENLFREDLFYRLAMIIIKLPALRERKTDIPAIANEILNQVNSEFAEADSAYKSKYFCDSTNKFIKKYDWPGNVRELRNVIIQSVVMSDAEKITIEDIKSAVSEQPGSLSKKSDVMEVPLGDEFDLKQHLDLVNKHYLERALKEANGAKTKAAKLLGFDNYQTLDAQLKRLNIDVEKFKK